MISGKSVPIRAPGAHQPSPDVPEHPCHPLGTSSPQRGVLHLWEVIRFQFDQDPREAVPEEVEHRERVPAA